MVTFGHVPGSSKSSGLYSGAATGMVLCWVWAGTAVAIARLVWLVELAWLVQPCVVVKPGVADQTAKSCSPKPEYQKQADTQ